MFVISTYRHFPLPIFFDAGGANCYTFVTITRSDLLVV